MAGERNMENKRKISSLISEYFIFIIFIVHILLPEQDYAPPYYQFY